jgi:GNAT superfamily N-acetyltransferase
MDKVELLKIEEAALNAWPAPRQMLYDGWVLRFAGGHSKRVNSVNPVYSSTLPLEEKIAACETVYASQGLPCLFRVSEITDPNKIQEGLAAAGYAPFDPTFVLGRPLEIGVAPHPEVTILEMPMEDWFRIRDYFIKTSAVDRQVHIEILNGIVPDKVLLGLFASGQPVACGMGVVEGPLLGFFSIYTDTRWRRKGYAGMIMAALTDWGLEREAIYGYLQVEGHNKPALALYEKLGFESLYQYVYYRKVNGD